MSSPYTGGDPGQQPAQHPSLVTPALIPKESQCFQTLDFFIFKMCTLEFYIHTKCLCPWQVGNFTDIPMSSSFFLIKILPLKINIHLNYRATMFISLNIHNFRKEN